MEDGSAGACAVGELHLAVSATSRDVIACHAVGEIQLLQLRNACHTTLTSRAMVVQVPTWVVWKPISVASVSPTQDGERRLTLLLSSATLLTYASGVSDAQCSSVCRVNYRKTSPPPSLAGVVCSYTLHCKILKLMVCFTP